MKLSASQLRAWRECRLRWQYRYKENLETGEAGVLLASGKAIHGTVEATLRGEITSEQWPEKTEALLQTYLAGREDVQEQAAKYLPGALRALSRLPGWILEHKWKVESPIEATWPEKDITIWGIPDYYRVEKDMIQILEVKSTSSDQRPVDYLLWNPQHREYSVILSKIYPDLPIFVRYIVLPTGRGSTAPMEQEWVMSGRTLAATEEAMLRTADEIRTLDVVPNYGRHCGFCDYKQLCTADITGGSSEALKDELFLRREPRE